MFVLVNVLRKLIVTSAFMLGGGAVVRLIMFVFEGGERIININTIINSFLSSTVGEDKCVWIMSCVCEVSCLTSTRTVHPRGKVSCHVLFSFRGEVLWMFVLQALSLLR